MGSLNSCHRYAADHNIRKVNLEFHWEHGEDYLHHFEDPETIIERCNYIHNFYNQQDRVEIHHIFNADGRYRDWKYADDVVKENGVNRVAAKNINKNRFWFQSDFYNDKFNAVLSPTMIGSFEKTRFKTTTPTVSYTGDLHGTQKNHVHGSAYLITITGKN